MAPLAVKACELPEHIVGEAGEQLTVGIGFTVKVVVAVPVQRLMAVPVTV